MPKSRLNFRQKKLGANVERDARQAAELEAAGWTVMTLWECETRERAVIDEFVEKVVARVSAAKPRSDSRSAC